MEQAEILECITEYRLENSYAMTLLCSLIQNDETVRRYLQEHGPLVETVCFFFEGEPTSLVFDFEDGSRIMSYPDDE